MEEKPIENESHRENQAQLIRRTGKRLWALAVIIFLVCVGVGVGVGVGVTRNRKYADLLDSLSFIVLSNGAAMA